MAKKCTKCGSKNTRLMNLDLGGTGYIGKESGIRKYDKYLHQCNNCGNIFKWLIMAKKCPNCNSKNTVDAWSGSSGDLGWADSVIQCNNCGNVFK